ncbi:lmo0954 family membrane protein [Gracilibacillus alcaliphilus]|uniref:lmo0954 family membrane protein n=1 Tax=Gracilibacillus alcaliphilus TaxID=1401441 RepID=UPI00195A5158|nr:flagellar basal body rod protein [Gracilibacillus alcaliphilus]MBM7677299.1 lia operon protein LiaI [Gracilibacillus alcaliphilus]MBM7678399.1 lia operon protein LiaI [Gracilibacillus alcaliphilus]
MKTFLIVSLAIIAGIVLLANLGPMIMLAISLVIAYFGVKHFILAETTGGKVGWAIVILIGISMSLSNIPALIGVVALVVLYYAYKKYQQEKETTETLDWDQI